MLLHLLFTGLALAQVPSQTNTYTVDIPAHYCNTNQEVAVPFVLPDPAHETVETNWKSLVEITQQGFNYDPTEGLAYYRNQDFYTRARFPIQQGANWTSTSVAYHVRFPLVVQALSPFFGKKAQRFIYENTAFAGFNFPDNYVYFSCGFIFPFQSQTFTGPHQAFVSSVKARLTLIWHDNL